jgi:hypothetical protein
MAKAQVNPLPGVLDDTLANLLLSKPPEVRAKMLLDLALSNGSNVPALHQLFTRMLQTPPTVSPTAEVAHLKALYEQALAELQDGPVRPATFIAEVRKGLLSLRPRVHVVTPDGQERYPTLHPQVKAKTLTPGLTVFLDAKGAVVLGASEEAVEVGQEGIFLRRLPESRLIEVGVRDERIVLHAAAAVLEAIESGRLVHGSRLLICPRRQFALAVIPEVKDRRHRFVDRSKVPAVVASRDIGKPHWILGWLIRRTRILLFRPDLLERFELRPRCALLLTGPTGTGKTLTIRAFLHEFNRMLVERTGRVDIGSRVIRAKVAELFSEWLGRSDKNIEELFDDIQAIAGEEIETASGERLRLPVVVILEEVEGVGRRRGEFDGGIYDRILGTLLQRLDDPTDDLGRLPVILITTTNRPELIDSAMWRRLAGVRARFGRLDREGLTAVLAKKLRAHYPYASCNGHSPDELRAWVIDQVVSWLYSPNDDGGLVELTFRDGKKAVRHRRDFLTGAVVEQAVATAIDQAVFQAEAGDAEAGLSAACLVESLRRHTDGLADNLTSHNAADYLDLPEHAAVASVRRLRSPAGQIVDVVAAENTNGTSVP